MYVYSRGRRGKIRLPVEARFRLAPDALLLFGAYSEAMTPIRVLIVDDVDRVRHDLYTFLTLTGEFEIAGECRNGAEAVRLAEIHRPQVILMDLEMPVMDGYEAARRIKCLQPTCRVIALTIHAGQAERQRASQAGVDRFIVKGAPLETLMEAIRNAPHVGQTPGGEK